MVRSGLNECVNCHIVASILKFPVVVWYDFVWATFMLAYTSGKHFCLIPLLFLYSTHEYDMCSWVNIVCHMAVLVSWSCVVQLALLWVMVWVPCSQIQNIQMSILCLDCALTVPEH